MIPWWLPVLVVAVFVIVLLEGPPDDPQGEE